MSQHPNNGLDKTLQDHHHIEVHPNNGLAKTLQDHLEVHPNNGQGHGTSDTQTMDLPRPCKTIVKSTQTIVARVACVARVARGVCDVCGVCGGTTRKAIPTGDWYTVLTYKRVLVRNQP